MLSLNEEQRAKIRTAWQQNNPRLLAEAAINTLFAKEFEDQIGLDHDDQVGNALYTGILAADAMLGKGKKTVENFILEFEKEVLNGEQVY